MDLLGYELRRTAQSKATACTPHSGLPRGRDGHGRLNAD
jgi:hypothetical protein